jgi:DNA-3-methyladenine glycosylase
VLIRAAQPLSGPLPHTNGPGKLARAFDLDRSLTGSDLTQPPLFFASGHPPKPQQVSAGPRVGIDYAGEWATRPWRFWIANDPWVSRGRPSHRPRARHPGTRTQGTA